MSAFRIVSNAPRPLPRASLPTMQIFRGEGTLAGESEGNTAAAVATRTPGAFFLPPC